MSQPIDWSLKVKRKDGQPISREEIEMLFNTEEWEDVFQEDDFHSLDAKDCEWEANFFTESMFADEDIRKALRKHSVDYPEYLFQTDRCYGDGDHYRTNFCDGNYEVMRGYIAYENPKVVEY